MPLRSILISCTAAMFALAAPATIAQARQSASALRCDATTVRIYFQHDSASIDDTARQLLSAAERHVGACHYSELHVMLDPANGRAAERGQAIRAAANGRAWNVVRIERRPALDRAAYRAGPDFAEVTMTPNRLPATNALIAPNVGV